MVQNLQFDAVNDRLPPQNIEAEEAILGGVLIDPEAIGRVMEILTPDAFYIGAHKEIYRAALDLHAKGQPTDLLTVTVWLKDHDKLEKVGGQARIAQLIDRTVSAANIDQYATLVMDKYTRRMLIQTGGEISQLGYDTTVPLEKVLDQSEQKLFGITQVRPQAGLTATSDILIDTFAEIEQRSLGVVLPGVPCGFYDLDAMTQGFQRSDLIITAARPSMGKCLSAEAQILLADGSLKTMAEIYQAQTADLLTLGPNWRFHLTQPSAYVDDGHKPVFRVSTRSGRTLETTLTHPYLTIQGWQPLSELAVGHKIAVPRILPIFGKEALPEAEMTRLIDQQGQDNFAQPTSRDTQVQDVGCIPSIIFRLNQRYLSQFLNRLFTTYGWVTISMSGQAQLGLANIQETLARQVQHLLLRFGILSQISVGSVLNEGDPALTWQLDITDSPSIKTFIQDIGIFGKEDAIERLKSALQNCRYQPNQDLIPMEVWELLREAKGEEYWPSLARRAGLKGTSNIHAGKRSLTRERLFALATALEYTDLQNLATSQVYWDEIVAIEPLGLKQVYDLTIPETHNFVANDICVHNTSFVLNIARNIAALQKLPVAIYSLEMSKLQLVYRLLSSEVEMESSRLRTGRIAQNEWEKLGHAISVLSQMPIFIDDTPNISITEIRSRCRRLQAEQGGALGLVLIDYLQLMEGGGDNRVQELSKMTRSLKGLARELNVPIIALSQLSRGVESRTNKRPMMSDLRECVAGDTLVILANGRRVPIQDLVGDTPKVISLDNHGKLIKAQAEVVWEVGTRPVYTLTTASGRKIRATTEHRLYTFDGWQRLKQLSAGSYIAVAQDRLEADDIFWDEVISIKPAGEEPVYDLTVPGPASWLADGIVSHNSGAIEQDADLIMMLYREEYYDPDTPDRGIAEVIITKHRNGPTGTVKLLFEPQFTRFRNLASPGM
jgi:replicative DNA helicase